MTNKDSQLRSIVTIFVFALLLCSVPVPIQAQLAQPEQTDDHLIWTYDGDIDEYKNGEIKPGEILVGRHRDRVSAAGIDAQLGLDIIEHIDLSGLDGATGDAGIEGLALRVSAGQEWAEIERLMANPTIAFAVPNWVVRAADIDELVQNDSASIETAFEVTDTLYAEEQWYLQRINASRAWQLAFNERQDTEATIQVAVIDSGIYTEHVELKSHLLPGINYLDPSSPPIDDYGHGTHIAGLIGAAVNNNTGIAGVAPWVELSGYKILNGEGTGSVSNLATAIRDATNNGADIINLSLQYGFNDPVVQSAVRMAAASNVLLIGAAGNCGSCATQYPAAYTEVMAIGATDYNDQRTSYSARGPELMAPGGTQLVENNDQILSTWSANPDATCGTGLVPPIDSPYCDGAGTSMAAGVVTGIAALIWSLDSELVSEDIRRILSVTAVPLDEADTGSGRVDAHAAVRSILGRNLNPSTSQIALRSTNGSAPFVTTVSLSNDSLNEVSWSAYLAADRPWITITGDKVGKVRYGEPAYISMIVSPTLLAGGFDDNQLRINTDLGGGGTTVSVDLFLDLFQNFNFFATVHEQSSGSIGPAETFVPFKWLTPSSPVDRETYVLLDNSSLDVDLPFDFPIGESSYDRARIHANGFVTFPSDDLSGMPDNYCQPSPNRVTNAIMGWMADLDPGQPTAQVSGFPVNTDRYVFEFLKVPTAAGISPAYEVSFQVILDQDGDVRLSYLDVPDDYDRPPLAAVGIETVDGRFRNLVFCADGETTLGITPSSTKTLLISPGDIY